MKMLKATDFEEAMQAFREEDFDTAVAPFAREQGEILEFITELGGELSEEEEIYLELTALNAWRLIKAAGFTAPPATRETMQALHRARLERLNDLFRRHNKEHLTFAVMLELLEGHPQEGMARTAAMHSLVPAAAKGRTVTDGQALVFIAVQTVFDALCGIVPPPELLGEYKDQPPRAWEGIRDLRVTEPSSDYTNRLMAEKDFKTIEEMNKFMEEHVHGKRLQVAPSTPPQKAQDLIYRAMDCHNCYVREQLARRALEISQDCADAYNLLAEETSDSAGQELDLYTKAAEAGARALGGRLKEWSGELWPHLEARPFMRAKAGIAHALWETDRRNEAEAAYHELLRLNKNDNQGIRYTLLAFYAEKNDLEKMDTLISGWGHDDAAAEWVYTKALTAFALSKPGATAALQAAFARNPHVPDYLLKDKEPPGNCYGDGITLGGEDEAYSYAETFRKVWAGTPGALVWLKTGRTVLAEPRPGRNEPCPCGSGKKYKKCCGR